MENTELQPKRRGGNAMKKLFMIVLGVSATTSSFGAGLPTPQDVENQLKRLYPNEYGAEMFPKGDQFEVLFISPPHPTSCIVDVATHQLSNCHYEDAAPASSPSTTQELIES